MSGAFETANQLAILAGARAPAWEDQPTLTGADVAVDAPLRAPELASDGVNLGGALYAMLSVPIRTNAHRRKGVITIGVFDATTNYTVTLGGNAFTSTTPANVATARSDLAAAIDAHADYTASVVGSTVVFYGATDADFSIVPSRSGGTGTLSVEADPSSATLRFWGWAAEASGYTAPELWNAIIGPGGNVSLAVDYRGALTPVAVAGLARLYVEVDALAGHASDSAGTGGTLTYTAPTVRIGPCILENG